MASPIELLVRVDSDTAGVAADFDKVSASAKSMGDAVDKAGSDADSAVSKMDRTASAADNMDSKFGAANGALGALAAGLEVAGFEKQAAAMETAAAAADGLSGVGQALTLVMELETAQKAKSAAMSAVHATQTWLANAASKAWAATQWLLNAALNANPIGLVVVAIIALIAVFVIVYKKSDKFRELVDGLWSGIQEGARAAGRVLTTVFSAAWDTLKTLVSWNPVDVIAKAWNGVTGALKAPFELAKTWIQSLFASDGPIADAVGKPLNWIAGVVSGITGLIKAPFEAALTWIQGLFSSTGAIATAVKGVTGIVSGVLQGIVNAINKLIDAFNKLPGPNLGHVSNPMSARGTAVSGGYTTTGRTTTGGTVVATGGRGPGTSVVINITGAIDPYQTGRQVERALARAGLVTGRVTP